MKLIIDQIRRRRALARGGIFLFVFVVLVTVLNYDFGGSLARSEERFDLLRSVGIIRDEYYGISPYWLERYGIALRDESDTHRDQDGDGLSLAEEYRYLTNPLDPDTDADGYPDGTEVANGYSPTGAGRLDMNRNGLPDHWEAEHGLPTDRDARDEDSDGDGLLNGDEYVHGTNPIVADSDGDGFDDMSEIRNGYDPVAPGETRPSVEIAIDRIGVVAPVVLSEDPTEAAIQRDLERGIIRYPDTANPGQIGNAFLTGHSSNYAWAAGEYNYILSRLDELEEGDTITLRAIQQNGKTIEYSYRVTKKFVASPDDSRLFAETEDPTVTLATCWPLNTSFRRLVVKAILES
jgi:LPXTG-site transpeptidase (sortase) family protein